MELAFPWPYTQGEWLAWSSAAATALFGIFALFAPRLALRVLRLQPVSERPDTIAEGRATLSGFYLGLGLCCILVPNSMLYMALGFCWLFTAFGRLVAMMSDRAATVYNWIALVVELALAALPLVFAFGLIA